MAATSIIFVIMFIDREQRFLSRRVIRMDGSSSSSSYSKTRRFRKVIESSGRGSDRFEPPQPPTPKSYCTSSSEGFIFRGSGIQPENEPHIVSRAYPGLNHESFARSYEPMGVRAAGLECTS